MSCPVIVILCSRGCRRFLAHGCRDQPAGHLFVHGASKGNDSISPKALPRFPCPRTDSGHRSFILTSEIWKFASLSSLAF